MQRFEVTGTDELGRTGVVGYFDLEAVTEIVQEPAAGAGPSPSGLYAGHEELLRTEAGRWVVYHNEYNGPEYHHYLTDDQARDWLRLAEAEEILTKYFGVPDERGPGRPAIGDTTTDDAVVRDGRAES